MTLEEEIKQKAFPSQRQKLMLNIIFTNSWLNYNYIPFFRKFDITSEQYNVLRILKGQHPNKININAIKERMLERMSNASRLVEKLRGKGLVNRDENQIDRRHADVSLTDAGIALLSKIKENLSEIEVLHDTITEEEALTVNQIIDKLRG